MMLMHVYNLTAAADVLSGEDWTEVETGDNAMTKYVTIEEGGFGNQTGLEEPAAAATRQAGSSPSRLQAGSCRMKEFLSLGGGGGAGMFSAL